MRILVIGAGAIGGYFGGRLLAAGRDVTFLVRPQRAALLARNGLQIISPKAGLQFAHPPLITADKLSSRYDLILLSCKAYDLVDAIASFSAAVGPQTMILPLLNGMAHIDRLVNIFGDEHVLGGQCKISATLDDAGRIHHLSTFHSLSFGERNRKRSQRILALADVLGASDFDSWLSDDILAEMWAKWVFIAAAAGLGCLMRGAVGDIDAAGGAGYAKALIAECAAIAARHEYPQKPGALQAGEAMLTEAGSAFKPSMLRDIERGQRTEADHIVSDLLRRAGDLPSPILRLADAHLKVYELQRARQAGA